MAIVTGRIAPAADFPMPAGTSVNGTLDVQLCGYGSQVPRVNGYALIGRLTEQHITTDADAFFTFTVNGNDQISPAGTFYTVTVRDGNGDIAQVNAYRFIGGGTYDLTLIDPYDPNQPPPPPPPLITNQLLVVPWSATMEFPGDELTTFRTTLTGDVISSTAPNTVQGNLYTFIIQQDATGGHAFTWPTSFFNPSPINPDPNGFTVQTFVMGLVNLVPIGAATWIR